MKTDISRSTFDARKRFSGVRMQQGRVQVDADWNEQLDIQRYRQRTTHTDVIGTAGVPRVMDEQGGADGFAVSVAEPPTSLKLADGRLYVDGILCEHLAGDVASGFDPVGLADEAEQGVYLVYLDVWERAVHAAEDPTLVDPALLVPDTSARAKVEWTLRATRWTLDQAPGGGDCDTLLAQVRRGDDQMPRMSAFADASTSDEGPCVLPAQAGYRGIENQLYRVEIHRGSDAGTPGLKWSRENAAVVFAVDSMTEDTVHLRDEGVAAKFDLPSSSVMEVVSPAREARGLAGPMVQLTRNPAAGARAFDVDVLDDDQTAVYDDIVAAGADGVVLRRWDHGDAANFDGGVVPVEEGTTLELERGVQVEFAPGEHRYRSGDYWLVAARAANDRRGSGQVLWPDDPQRPGQPAFRPPEGVQHHFAALALVRVVDDGGLRYEPFVVDDEPADCRKPFAPLTDVQQAIDELRSLVRRCCQFVLRPERPWRAELGAFLEEHDSVEICIPPETVALETPLVLEGLDNVRIHGAGPASRLDAGQGLGALVFANCGQVEVYDLAVGAGIQPNQPEVGRDVRAHGAVTFTNCTEVGLRDVDVDVRLRETDYQRAFTHSTACVYARFSQKDHAHKPLPANQWGEPTNNHVRFVGCTPHLDVSGCNFHVGYRQQGLVVLDGGRVRVQNNRIWCDSGPRFKTLAANKEFRKQVVDRLLAWFSDRKLGADFPYRQKVEHNGVSAWFAGDPMSKEFDLSWQDIVEFENPDAKTARDLQTCLHKRVDKMIFSNGIPEIAGAERWRKWRNRLQNMLDGFDYGLAGVVVAGRMADRVRVVQNDIEGFTRGVHVGLQNAAANDVLVRDNHVEVRLPYGYNRERHAIFVGNFERVAIHDNRLTVSAAMQAYPQCDGVRVYGTPGQQMIISGNWARGFHPGIHTVFIEPPYLKALQGVYTVSDNLASCQLMRTPDPQTGEHVEVEEPAVVDLRNRA